MDEIQIHLRVQCEFISLDTDIHHLTFTTLAVKPRVLEKTNKKVWIPESVTQGPVPVNVTCLVNADPVASFEWYTHEDRRIPTDNTQGIFIFQ